MNARDLQSDFEQYAQEHLEEFEQLINRYVPQKGEKSDSCLHTSLKIALFEMENVVNGAEEGDFEPDPNYRTINEQAGFIGLEEGEDT